MFICKATSKLYQKLCFIKLILCFCPSCKARERGRFMIKFLEFKTVEGNTLNETTVMFIEDSCSVCILSKWEYNLDSLSIHNRNKKKQTGSSKSIWNHQLTLSKRFLADKKLDGAYTGGLQLGFKPESACNMMALKAVLLKGCLWTSKVTHSSRIWSVVIDPYWYGKIFKKRLT